MFVIDELDRDLADDVRDLGMEAIVMNTIMNNNRDKVELARKLLKAVTEADDR